MLKTLRELKFTMPIQIELRANIPQLKGCVDTKEEAIRLSSELEGFELIVRHVWSGRGDHLDKKNRYWTVGRDRFDNRARDNRAALAYSRKKRDKLRHH